jgi:DNA-binding NtrC family response regulator
MTNSVSNLKGKQILVVDDEKDVLETIKDILDDASIDMADNYEDAVKKIEKNKYDIAVLDIMGVNGLDLLGKAVKAGLPAVMLTAHAVSPEALMESIRKGAISYLPKESLMDLDALLSDILNEYEHERPAWKLLFDKLGGYFDKRFGENWKDKNKNFWSEFEKNYQISKGIQERLKSNPNIMSKGI